MGFTLIHQRQKYKAHMCKKRWNRLHIVQLPYPLSRLKWWCVKLCNTKFDSQLAPVISPVGCFLSIGYPARSLSQTVGEKNHPVALVRQCVMLLIPTGLQALIVCRWKRSNYGIRRLWQMGVTCTEKSFHELEFMNIYMWIFPHTHAVAVLLHEHSFSTGGRRVVLGFSLMAEFSCWGIKSLPLLLFFAHFLTQALTQWQLPSMRLAIRNKTRSMLWLTVKCCVIEHAGLQGSEVNFVDLSINWYHGFRHIVK